MANLVLEGNKLKRPEDRINIKGIAVGNPGVESGSLHLSPPFANPLFTWLTLLSARGTGQIGTSTSTNTRSSRSCTLDLPPACVWLFEFLTLWFDWLLTESCCLWWGGEQVHAWTAPSKGLCRLLHRLRLGTYSRSLRDTRHDTTRHTLSLFHRTHRTRSTAHARPHARVPRPGWSFRCGP